MYIVRNIGMRAQWAIQAVIARLTANSHLNGFFMKVARHIIEARREAIAKLLSKVGYVPVLEICKQFNVSEATARRDLTELESQRRITRTHGGALSDFNRNFPPLDDRKVEDAEAKRKIGNLAASRVKPGMTVYLDSGATSFFAAEAIASAGVADLQIVTTCLPTAQLISCLPGVEVYIPGGLFLTRHAMVAGDRTLEEVARWNFDVALLGAEGIDENGLWNSQRDISHQQREVIRRSDEVLICMNKIKLGRGGPCAVTRDVSPLFLVTDADAAEVAIGPQVAEIAEPLSQPGIAGAVGWVAGYTNAFPKSTIELYKLSLARDVEKALPLYRLMHPLLRWDSKTEFVQSIKLSMDMVGRYGGPCRPPRQPLTPEQEKSVRAVTQAAIDAGLN